MKLSMPFQKLMELVEAVHANESRDITIGELSHRWDEPPNRIMDAIDAVRVKNGEQTYFIIDVPPEETL
jgi:hypothetical protein